MNLNSWFKFKIYTSIKNDEEQNKYGISQND